MTAYVVTATRLYQLRPDGSEKRYNAGDVVTDLTEDDIKRHLAAGNIIRKNKAEAAAGDEDGSGEESGPERPAKVAPKADWVAYVVAATADTESPVSHDEADAMTKADLIELYG